MVGSQHRQLRPSQFDYSVVVERLPPRPLQPGPGHAAGLPANAAVGADVAGRLGDVVAVAVGAATTDQLAGTDADEKRRDESAFGA